MKEENIIKHPTGTIIMNGGNPLPGCPSDWDEAKIIQGKLNEGKNDDEPQWSFNCGFKLDFDGSIININSRFYPPKSHYGATWDGIVHIYLMGNELKEKKFDCSTLDELKIEVENYVKLIIEKIKHSFD